MIHFIIYSTITIKEGRFFFFFLKKTTEKYSEFKEYSIPYTLFLIKKTKYQKHVTSMQYERI